MSKYIGTPVVSLVTDTVDVTGDITTTDATPEVIIVNDTHEDTDGGREGKVTFKGQQSGGEETTLAQIQASHDGTSDDEKGDLIFKTNDGSDGASPTERLRIDSNGSILTTTLGGDNVHIGEGAGVSITSGANNNVTIGKSAGTALTTGDNNVAVGYQALFTEDGHGNNTAIGYRALKVQNAGANAGNTALGYDAGVAVTDGHSNTLLGTLAGSSLTTGDENTYVGYSAGSTGSKTFTGVTALGFNSISAGANVGDSTTAIGWSTLKNTNAGAAGNGHNTALGYNAGRGNDTGYDNTFIGSGAGSSVTTGYSNSFLGKGAGSTITTGNSHTIIGRFDGNQGGLDIRTATNQIVLSDGAGTPHGGYNGLVHASYPHWNFNSGTNSYFAGSVRHTGTAPYGFAVNFTGSAPNNTSREFIFCNDTSASRFTVFANGTVQNATGSYGTYSDQKLKENIADSGSQWDDIKAVRVRKYSLKADELDEPNQIGVIAQELESSGMNGLVYESFDKDENGLPSEVTTKSVKYSILYMKAIKALQEAMTRIETLETQNTTQATQIADLITRVETLEGE